jgi:hypothetical protein
MITFLFTADPFFRAVAGPGHQSTAGVLLSSRLV